MKETELRKRLTDTLSKLYGMNTITRLEEFWQGEQRVLYYLCQHKGGEINPSALSHDLHVSRARITTALTALRKKGYITMELCQKDRRRMRVIMTENGRQYIDAKQAEIEAGFDRLIGGLGENETLKFIELIQKSIDIMI